MGNEKGSEASAPVKPKGHKGVITRNEVAALSLDELKEKTDNFGSKQLIGEGSYGRVYFATLSNGKTFAVKKLDVRAKRRSNRNSDHEYLTRASFVSKLEHENLVELLGYWVERNVVVFAYEFAPMGSLYDVMHGRKGVRGAQPGPVLDWMRRARIADDAARGLEYLHKNSIIHGDVRSNNVLLFEDLKAKIVDFYLPKKTLATADRKYNYTDYDSTAFPFTGLLNQKSDIYSFGVVLLELLTGRKPIDHSLPQGEQMSLVSWATSHLREDNLKQHVDPKLKGKYPTKVVETFFQLAALCMQFDERLRPNMSFVVKALQPLLKIPALTLDV